MVLKINNLSVEIAGKKIVDDISFSLEPGKIIGLFGPNGSGKSTAFCAFSGIIPVSSGSIEIHTLSGVIDVTHQPLFKRVGYGLGYLPQDRTLIMDLTVEENIRAVIECSKIERPIEFLEYLLDCFSLNALRHRLGRFLSGGERRRCELACLLAHKPLYLLLDEPFAGIDPISIKQIKSILNHLKSRYGILITDHQFAETVNVCSYVYIMKNGKIVSYGTPENVSSDQAVRNIYLGD